MTYRIAVAAAVVAIAVTAGIMILPRAGGPGGVTSPSPDSPAPSTSPTSPPTVIQEGPLAAGRYLALPFTTADPSLAITFTVPEGWTGFGGWGLIGPPSTEAPDGVGAGFLSASGLFSDPCHWDLAGTGVWPQAGDIDTGSTAADLAAALHAHSAYESTVPADVVVSGFPGKSMDIVMPSDVDFTECDSPTGETTGAFFVWGTEELSGNDVFAQGSGERRHLLILDVGGTRIIIFNNDYAGTSPEHVSQAEAIIDSIEITP